MIRLFFLSCVFQLAFLSDPPCVIDLECAECIPDNMPLVTSHRASNGSIRVGAGDEVALSCGAGRLLAYPLLGAVGAACEAGRFRVRQDGALRHLLELGCQENIFEDVLHTVEHCAPPLQGRAYRMMESSGNTRHLAAVCFDADRGLPARAHVSSARAGLPRLAPHAESRGPLSLLGNFNHMFDAGTRRQAEALYSDEGRLNRRLREMFKHEQVDFGEQTLTGAKLLDSSYFDDQDMRVTDFVSNKVPVWRSVALGNLKRLQRDVAAFVRRAHPHAALDVYAGTLGVLALRTGRGRAEVHLKPERFPVPRYVWTVVHDRRSARALAVVVLNDPFVAVSEVREAVFCESACGRATWLRALRRRRSYETPLLGLAFCCAVRAAAPLADALPPALLRDVPPGDAGLLTELQLD